MDFLLKLWRPILPGWIEGGLLIFPIAPGWGAVMIAVPFLLGRLPQGLWRSQFGRPVTWVMGGLMLWLMVVSAIAVYPQDSWLGLGNWWPFMIIFLAYSPLIKGFAELRRWMWLMVGPSLWVSLLGIGQVLWGWALPHDWTWPLVGWELQAFGHPEGRLASVFMYANTAAAYLTMMFLLSLGLWVGQYLAFRRDRTHDLKIWLYLTATVWANGLALLLTSSRNAWAIAFAGVVIFALYIGWWWILAFFGGLGGAIAEASFGDNPWRDRLRQIVPHYFWGRLSDEAYVRPVEGVRLTQWEFVVEMIKERPLTGWGLRSFTPYYLEKMNVWRGHPHNFFLMLTSEIGIPMMVVFCGLIGWILAQAIGVMKRCENPQDRLLIFTNLITFAGIIAFNTLDVTILDLRLNAFAWFILLGLWGIGLAIDKSPQKSASN